MKTTVYPNGYNLIGQSAHEIGFRGMENAIDILQLKNEQYRMRCIKFRGRTDYFLVRLAIALSVYRWQCLSHPEEEREIVLGAGGSPTLHLPEKNSFRLYRYY